MPFSIEKTSVAEMEASPHFVPLMKEYEAEVANPKFPPPSWKWEVYKGLEVTGLMTVFRVEVDGLLVGMATMLMPVMPHYTTAIAVTESLFVSATHRRFGVGLRLLRAIEAEALAKGSPGLFVSAPAGGSLEKVLPRRGYEQTNTVFYKCFQSR